MFDIQEAFKSELHCEKKRHKASSRPSNICLTVLYLWSWPGKYSGWDPNLCGKSFLPMALIQRSTFIQLTGNQNQLISASLAIQTFSNKLIYYQLSCNHIYLVSSLIYYPASLAIRPICYQSSDAINNLAIKFWTFSQSLFLPFFSPKNRQKKNGKISQHLEIFILWKALRGCCLK